MGVKRGTWREVRWIFYKGWLEEQKRFMDLMFMLGLIETIGQLAMASRVHWYDHVLRREDGHVYPCNGYI